MPSTSRAFASLLLFPIVAFAACGGGDSTDESSRGTSGSGGGGVSGSGSGKGGAAGKATAGSGTAGSATAGASGTAGSATAGASGSATGGASGKAGSSTAGASGTAGSSTAGSSTAGASGTAGSSAAGASGTAGSSAAGASGTAGGAGSGGGCTPGDTPPAGLCTKGVCAATAPTCVAGAWTCGGPGYEPVEETCDGFDNDCDGLIDEGCASCTVPLAAIQANLDSVWDIDFDYACNTYLTSLISGPDFAKVIPADGSAVKTYFGNANQDMGYGLVDPDPKNARVVVAYACGDASCLAKNGMTLLYTCAKADAGCGCAAETNCPGFLDAPFLDAPNFKNTSATFNGYVVSTPTGLAAGAGRNYYVGNYRPIDCDATAACTKCDPAHPTETCSPTKKPCCDASPALGRVVRFTLPGVSEPTFRVDAELAGEEVLGLASGRDGSVFIGTYVNPTKGNLYRLPPGGTPELLQTFGGPVFSVTQVRSNGDLYVEVHASPKIVHLDETGKVLALPANVPSDPPNEGVLQAGPDGKLYRLIGRVDAQSTLEVY